MGNGKNAAAHNPAELSGRDSRDAVGQKEPQPQPQPPHHRQAAKWLEEALERLYPGVKSEVGPAGEHGFHCDADMDSAISSADLPRIEREMAAIAAADGTMGGNARENDGASRSSEADRPSAPAFKLLSVSGAYLHGDSRNKMLQRLHVVAFASSAELDSFLAAQEEAQKRDHRKLGKQLELFMFSDEAPGMPFYLPKGQAIRNELENLSRDMLRKYGYDEVRTPLMMNRRLWEESGHWEHYRDNMYFTEIDGNNFALKPMNCPGHMLVYKNRLRSYRELPIRLAEFGQVHRHEYSGALNGMLRVRTFCQDDAHIFVASNQIGNEIVGVIRQIEELYAVFGFACEVELSTRPESSLGSDEQWEQAEAELVRALEEAGRTYRINPGDGAFYGPKIDFHIRDALNRSHQCATIQLDFQMPEKFELSYTDENNAKAVPVVIHRAIYGSIDRFFGILIEHYAGAFPVWLAPVQVKVLSVADRHAVYAEEVLAGLRQAGIRAETDNRNEKLGYKIRDARLQQIPYTVVVGDRERDSREVAVRRRGDAGESAVTAPCGLDDFIAGVLDEIRLRR